MPKSKRSRVISLTRTDKKLDTKDKLIDEVSVSHGEKLTQRQVRSCCDEYSSIWLFSVRNMRNAKLKEVRHQWKHSR